MSVSPTEQTTDLLYGDPIFPNVEDFRHHFDDMDITQDQADELIIILFNIMSAFVDLGFGLHPSQDCLLETLINSTNTQ